MEQKCKECASGLGTALLIQGAGLSHATRDHSPTIHVHQAAKSCMSGLLELIGPKAVAHLLWQMMMSDLEREALRKTFAELAGSTKTNDLKKR